ncbi:MAG: type II toxin-antitoxin system ParD family antitoxin [Alphaproteobacteria bacterium]|nr:type II toxin-antitoxin system ParD family antitoxin [Alphaproteobacteria bacterium]
MSITLAPLLEQLVNDKVRSGAYRSPEEVLHEALHLLDERERRLSALRADIQLGLDLAEQGDVAPLDMEALIGALRAKHETTNPAKHG